MRVLASRLTAMHHPHCIELADVLEWESLVGAVGTIL
jgi:hypothetical protein